MYNEDDINSAVTAGIFDEQVAKAFRQHASQRRQTTRADEENFRLVTGFNDIFVVVACLLLLISASWITGQGERWIGGLVVAALSWGLAEFFVRKRRMALPAIVLLAAFVSNVFFAVAQVHMVLINTTLTAAHGPFALASESLTTGGIAAALAAYLHWRRFRVPITVAAGTAVTLVAVLALLLNLFPELKQLLVPISLICGLGVFALAMRWDSADPLRQSRDSDAAFWLHLLAAPLLVHPVFSEIAVSNGTISSSQAAVVMLTYVLIALVSLAIDRRALMVSALGYVLYSLSHLFEQHGMVSQSFSTTALIIGAALLMLSAFWQPCRRFALNFLPQRLRQHLPPLLEPK